MVQKRSIKTDDVRTERYMFLSDKAKVLLLDLKTNASDSYGFVVDTGMSILATSHGGKDLEECHQALDELVKSEYLYNFGNGTYLIMDWQRDNSLDYQKTTQPTAPDLLTYIYASDNDSRYHLSAIPIRSSRGWKDKIYTRGGKLNKYAQDNVPSRNYIFESGIEPGFTIVPFDTKLEWSDDERKRVTREYALKIGYNPETGEIKKEEAPKLASSTHSSSDNCKQDSDTGDKHLSELDAKREHTSTTEGLPF